MENRIKEIKRIWSEEGIQELEVRDYKERCKESFEEWIFEQELIARHGEV